MDLWLNSRSTGYEEEDYIVDRFLYFIHRRLDHDTDWLEDFFVGEKAWVAADFKEVIHDMFRGWFDTVDRCQVLIIEDVFERMNPSERSRGPILAGAGTFITAVAGMSVWPVSASTWEINFSGTGRTM